MEKKEKQYSRRSFFTKSLSGIASAGLLGFSSEAASWHKAKNIEQNSSKEIIYRILGKTGIKLPIVSMGLMNSFNPELVRKSYEIGVRHFDTAAVYQRGANEEMIGKVIKELNARDKVIIATKVIPAYIRRRLSPLETKKVLLQTVEESLKRLQTDYVDILYLHHIDNIEELNNPEIKDALQMLKEQQKARFIGFSTHRNIDCINEAAKTGFYDVILTIYNYALHDENELFEAIRNAASKGIGIIAMKTQCGNYLHRQGLPLEMRKYYKGGILNSAVLKWALRNSYITTAIPGYTTFEQMEEDFSVAYDLEYTPEEKQFIEDKGVNIALGYCHQCKKCVPTCPHGVDIPALMRIHMYATCYSNFHQARDTLDSIPKERSLAICSSCDRCKATCANHINIAERIDELKVIYV